MPNKPKDYSLFSIYNYDLSNIEQWKQDPMGLYKAIQEIKNEHIFHGYSPKHFHFPVAKPAIDEIKKSLAELDFAALGIADLQADLDKDIKDLLKDILAVETGIEQEIVQPKKDYPNSQSRVVTYPYQNCLAISSKFAEIMDYVYRIKAYSDLNKELNNTELATILKSDLSPRNKVEALGNWDFKRCEQQLTNETNKKPSRMETIKAMRLPLYYQNTTWGKFVDREMMKDEGDSFEDSILIPSFLPLDLAFFTLTRETPVFPVGLINFEHLFADAYKHTPMEFFYHDIKHAWDMVMFNMVAMRNTGLSPNELYQHMATTRNYVIDQLTVLKDSKAELHDAIEVLLFELLHEEAHSWEQGDVKEGFDNPSMYNNYFLDRLDDKFFKLNFFGEEGEQFARLRKYFPEGIALIKSWVQQANNLQDNLELNRPQQRFTSNHYAKGIGLNFVESCKFSEEISVGHAKPKVASIVHEFDTKTKLTKAKRNTQRPMPNVSKIGINSLSSSAA